MLGRVCFGCAIVRLSPGGKGGGREGGLSRESRDIYIPEACVCVWFSFSSALLRVRVVPAKAIFDASHLPRESPPPPFLLSSFPPFLLQSGGARSTNNHHGILLLLLLLLPSPSSLLPPRIQGRSARPHEGGIQREDWDRPIQSWRRTRRTRRRRRGGTGRD